MGRHAAVRSVPDMSTHEKQWELNPRPFDLESNALSTLPHAPKWFQKRKSTDCIHFLLQLVSVVKTMFHRAY